MYSVAAAAVSAFVEDSGSEAFRKHGLQAALSVYSQHLRETHDDQSYVQKYFSAS